MSPKLNPALLRCRRILNERIRPQVTTNTADLQVWAATAHFEPVSFVQAKGFVYQPFVMGSSVAPAWHTRWFILRGHIPKNWDIDTSTTKVAVHLDLGFIGNYDGFQVEAMLYRDGCAVQAIQPDRRRYVLEVATPGEDLEFYLEIAATPMVSNLVVSKEASGPTITQYADPATTPTTPLYRLNIARLERRLISMEHFALVFDTVLDLATDLSINDPMYATTIRALEDSIANIDIAHISPSAQKATEILNGVLSLQNGDVSHQIVATGHAHLDTAWLWPLRETRRKAARTFVNAIGMARRHPQHVFSASQAQHYEWVRVDHPDLFVQIQRLVADAQWSPVGGMWVEADLNLSGGESLCRQFLYGQSFFEKWFGARSDVAFLPDDFGYPAALPQIVSESGCSYFFTQKLSWNETNVFPHHLFWWQGLDGSRVLTHFSPIDTYNATNSPSQLRFAAKNYLDHAISETSLSCFGHGDGGGGPTDEMVQRTQLLADVSGIPRVRFGSPSEFFAQVSHESGDIAPIWVGEMYLEKHRGTLTSQVKTKQASHAAERALREAELWSVSTGASTPDLAEQWQNHLTQQFHDILPGSSITWVHQDAERILGEVISDARAISATAISTTAEQFCLTVVNASSFDHCGVVISDLPAGLIGLNATVSLVVHHDDQTSMVQRLSSGRIAFMCSVPALSTVPVRISEGVAVAPENAVVSAQDASGILVSNDRIAMHVTPTGDIDSLIEISTHREIVPTNAEINRLVLRSDQPGEYDAWDIDEPDTRGSGNAIEGWSVELIDDGSLVTILRRSCAVGPSHFLHDIMVCAGEAIVNNELHVLWNHDETRLQVQVPLDIHASVATCGTQFGHIERPRHTNTSWDAAKFEVCAHRYVHVGEPRFGVALMSAGAHGFDVRSDSLCMSLLRSPRFPDPVADRGEQTLGWAIWINAAEAFAAGLEAQAHRLTDPVYTLQGETRVGACIEHDLRGVVVEAVKYAHDGSGDIIVRIWESSGDRVSGKLQTPMATGGKTNAMTAHESNILEDTLAPISVNDGSIVLTMRPFEIRTLRFKG
ncbi:MAG: alpha-mannosidase [Ilumatobacteraceae bacterium]|nr:alpha-mannosidase [Ilumatobacteraceae bacterium]